MLHVANNKQLPKYSFERSVDAFLGVFLPEIVAQLWDPAVTVELVAQEFPLKKSANNQSTNVDYLLHLSGMGETWLFLELKTDLSSHRDHQAAIYAEKLVNASMNALVDDVATIASASTKKAKYTSLLSRFDGYSRPLSGDVAIAYLAPRQVSAKGLLPKSVAPKQVSAFSDILRSWTFDQLRQVSSRLYPDAWDLFKLHIVPAVLARARAAAS
jgi:hypothetical protein